MVSKIYVLVPVTMKPALQSVPVCSGIVALQNIYNSIHMFGPIEVTPDNQDNSISFMIPSSRENLNQFYDATITLTNSAGSATSNINISEYSNIYLSFFLIQILYRYS